MMRFAVLCVALLSSLLPQVAQSAFLISQNCSYPVSAGICSPLSTKAVQDLLEECRKEVVEENLLSVERRQLRHQEEVEEEEEEQQEHRQLATPVCPEPLSCKDDGDLCFEDMEQRGCGEILQFGQHSLNFRAKARVMERSLKRCVRKNKKEVLKKIREDSKACRKAAKKALKNCDQLAYVFM